MSTKIKTSTGWKTVADCGAAAPHSYSTNEQKTGGFWIDGKPIYRKVFTGLSFNGGATGWVNTGVTSSGLQRIIECKGWRESSGVGELIYYSATTLDVSGKVSVHGHNDGLNPTNCLCIEYTKTTD